MIDKHIKNGQSSDAELRGLPARFFSEWLPAIDDLAELKVTIFFLAQVQQKEGDYRYLRRAEFLADSDLMRGLALLHRAKNPAAILDMALEKAVKRGSLLVAEIALGQTARRYYFENDARGQLLQSRMQAGDWRPAAGAEIELLPPRPSIYQLYEENIGALTPMIAEALKEAEQAYPRAWIEEALRYAVERNARNWRYISKVLDSWQQEGRSHETSERHHERQRKYTTGKWKDYIQS